MRANTRKPIDTVTIVGGGTAGWMTAALLSQLIGRTHHIRLIESDRIGTIGVGEATIPAIRIFNQLAGIDQNEMMKATGATFKLGIEFVDWGAIGESYIHGFGKIGQDLLWLHPHQFWLKLAQLGRARAFDDYALNCLAARRNRFCMPDPRNPGSPMADIDYAFHFDAARYAAFLRTASQGRGVERIEGQIVDIALEAETGFVRSLKLQDGRVIDGDLFIDCSGMRSLLLGDALGVGFDDWRQWLPCDRALAVPCTSAPVLTPYTRSTARSAGWQWRIPLQHRLGNGIVYAGECLSDSDAAQVLLANLDGTPLDDPRPVRFTPGKRHRAWDRNVVGIGLSAGFLEPLESTSIHLIQTAILRLIALFPDKTFDPASIDEYNRQTDFEFKDIRDFLIAHYKVTRRQDTEFWRYVANMAVPDSLAARLDLFRGTARFFPHGKAELFREESWVQVLIGQGLPMQYDPMVDIVPEAEMIAFMRDIEDVIADCADAMPRHADFIARHCMAADADLPELMPTAVPAA